VFSRKQQYDTNRNQKRGKYHQGDQSKDKIEEALEEI
jgi:hypothetical protein